MGLRQQDIVSGAGHDAAFLAKIAPAAMLPATTIGVRLPGCLGSVSGGVSDVGGGRFWSGTYWPVTGATSTEPVFAGAGSDGLPGRQKPTSVGNPVTVG